MGARRGGLPADGGGEILTVYYDSFFPMEVALGGKLAEHGRKVFAMIRDGPYEVVVSQVVVGETHAVLMRRYPDRHGYAGMAVRLRDAILATGAGTGTSPRGGLRPLVPGDVLEVMAGLLARVPELDGTDLVILAIALADPYAAYLLTQDRVLLRNEGIMRYERDLRSEGKRRVRLRITNKLPPARRARARPARRTRDP